MNDERHAAPFRRFSVIVYRLISSLWLGGAVFLAAIAAPAAFSAASNTTEAANFVGAMLTRWHYLALLAPLILLIMQWSRPRAWAVLVLFLAIVFASGEAMIDLRIRNMRLHMAVPISSLPPDSAVRRHFGALHGTSVLLLLGQIAAAAIVAGASESGTDRADR